MASLKELHLQGNQLSAFPLSQDLPQLETLTLSRNQLTSFTLPNDAANLQRLDLSHNQLTSFRLPDGLTDLEILYLSGNQLTAFALPQGLESLQLLSLKGNQLSVFPLSQDLPQLETLTLSRNQLASFALPNNMANLRFLSLAENPLRSFTIPQDLTRLEWLDLSGISLTAVTYPNDWAFLSLSGKGEYGGFHLEVSPAVESLFLRSRGLTSLTLPEGLSLLKELDLSDNPLRRLLVPHGMNVENLEVYGFPKSEVTRYFAEAQISIRPVGNGQIIVEFNGEKGILQTTESLLGKWKDRPEWKSPFRFSPSAPQKFFRVRPAF